MFAGSLTRYGRLPVPVLFALDEVTQTCSVPLDSGWPLQQVQAYRSCYVVHSPTQLEARYGKPAAEAIWALVGVKVVLAGNSDEEIAEDISKLCGHYGDEKSEMVVPPAYIRQLPECRGL